MIEAGIDALLANTTSISNIIRGRVWPLFLPEEVAYPAMTYQVISHTQEPTFATSGMQKLRLQIDCWGDASPQCQTGYADAAGLRDAVVTLLNGYRGALPDGTYVQDAELEQSIDFYESGALAFRAMCEFSIFYTLT